MAPSRFQTFTFTLIQRLRGNFFCGDKFHIHFGHGASFFAETNFASDGKFAGSIFLVRGYGARFIAEQNFASDEKFATSIFGSGATGQALSRSKISQAMKSWQKVFFGPGLRGKIFGGEKCRKR